ncbi:MAG: hypothetical protein Q4A17_10460 [Thermoguttaceae bacterium]|nr:hypothetical protein [Thermoguttaceae bacterium]MDO4858352.1 hypothetical protein [Thermoguttaceae bacterium]
MKHRLIFSLVFLLLTALPALAQLPGLDSTPNTQTVGGIFFWKDVQFRGEWHIQKSILADQYRLLDPLGVCRASGSREFCEKILAGQEIPAPSGKVLVLLHGFASGSILLENMAIWFRETGDYTAVLNVSYPAFSVTIEQATDQLAEIIASLEGAERVDFVGHSLGSIIMRYFLGNYDKRPENIPIGRLVQICPPNQGAEVARDHNAGPLGLLIPVLDQLSMKGPEMKEKYGLPRCEFGILAGYGEDGYFGGEENDAVLAISATRLDNAKEWKKIRGDHCMVPNKIETFENVREFLTNGHFLEENSPSPP